MKKMIILLGCVGCMMLSCSKDPQDTNSKKSDNNVHEWEDSTLSGDAVMGEMKFSVNNVMSVERQGSTRSTTEYNGTCAFSEGDRIAIRVSRSSVVEDVKLYEVQLDGSLECLDTYPFTWRSLSDAVDIQAWSYGDASTTKAAPEDSDYSLETNQQTNGYRELLYCNAPSTGYSANSITLNFYHQLARVVFNVTHERSGTLSVTSYSLGNTTSFPVTARFAVPTGSSHVGTWTTRSTYNTITPKTETPQSGYQKTYSAVIFPRTYDQNTKFFTITNNEGDYVFNISESGGFTPIVGNQYNYTINVKDLTNVRKNPLWYLSNYSIASSTKSNGEWTCTNGTDGRVYFTWANFLSNFTPSNATYTTYTKGNIKVKDVNDATFHAAPLAELHSIIPLASGGYDMMNNTYLVPNTITTEVTSCFGYSTTTKQAIQRSSFWDTYTSGSKTRYAIRYLDTEHCSAWRYTKNSNGDLVINARLINQMSASNSTANINALKAKITEIKADASFWTENEGLGSVQLIIPRNTVHSSWPQWLHYWVTDARTYFLRVNLYDGETLSIYSNDGISGNLAAVLLFRDN